jgi:hypothetical protein
MRAGVTFHVQGEIERRKLEARMQERFASDANSSIKLIPPKGARPHGSSTHWLSTFRNGSAESFTGNVRIDPVIQTTPPRDSAEGR